jgi:hypothetical protein
MDMEKLVSSMDIDLNSRWEKGTEHHPQAIQLAKLIAEIDYQHNTDRFGFKFGGDGDSGEDLAYILSEIIERGLLPGS